MSRWDRLLGAMEHATDDGQTFCGLLVLAVLIMGAVLVAVRRAAIWAGGQGWEPLVGLLALGAGYLVGRALVQVARHYRDEP